ncbi:VOC family protein [Mucilaginibacter sp.]|uniref:VOC family protein n=1 Tax=Mucilaginibacter sp. TaxID=1882438 RepID=UPI0035BC63ED
MESLSPNFFVKDISSTIDFYKLLGFEVAMSVPPEGTDLVWVMMTNGGVSMMFQTMESLGNDLPQIHRTDGSSLLMYITVKDIQGFFDRIKEQVTVLKGLETTFYGATEFSILDPNNYVLTFAEHQEQDDQV